MTWAVHSDVDQSDLNTVTTMSAPYTLHSASNWVHHLELCSVLSHSSIFFHTTQLRYRILISFHYLFSFLLYTYMFTIILCVYIYSFANLANWFYFIFYLAIIIHPVLLSISYILTPPFFMFLIDLWHYKYSYYYKFILLSLCWQHGCEVQPAFGLPSSWSSFQKQHSCRLCARKWAIKNSIWV